MHIKNKEKSSHNSDEVHTFGGTSFNQESNQNKSTNAANSSIKASDMWRDFEPIQGWMRALTNQIVYLFDDSDNMPWKQNIAQHKSNRKKILSSTNQITPKQPHSPVFYTSSDLMENTSLQGVSSKEPSSNESQLNKIIKEENKAVNELNQEISSIKMTLESQKYLNFQHK